MSESVPQGSVLRRARTWFHGAPGPESDGSDPGKDHSDQGPRPGSTPSLPRCLPVALVSPSARCKEQGEVKISSQRVFRVPQSLVVH